MFEQPKKVLIEVILLAERHPGHYLSFLVVSDFMNLLIKFLNG